MRQLNILVVDDEVHFAQLLCAILKKRGHRTQSAAHGKAALQRMEQTPFDLVITDLRMEQMGGMELLNEIKRLHPSTHVIVVTAYASVQSAVEAMRQGAFSYFIKTNNPEELLFDVEKVAEIDALKQENQMLRQQNQSQNAMLSTQNEAYANVLALAQRVAQTDANVLLIGESGSGKEILTKYIHQQSSRREHILVNVNCHALSESLLESELYGHEKGAFTGSAGARIGRFEAAEGGTLFLDEIGDISLSTQTKLLRNVETKEITRIGSNDPIPVDFRLICATNRNLQEAIAAKEFREDFFYRISTVTIEIPPLRARKEDLPMLIDFFLESGQRDMKKRIRHMDDALRELLLAYDYPGNIRELKNIIERLIVMSEGDVLTLSEAERYGILPRTRAEREGIQSLRAFRAEQERSYISSILARYGADIDRAAAALDISARQLYNKIKELDIKR